MSWHYGFAPYVPVARRRAQAAVEAAKMAKKEKRTLTPIRLDGRKIATSFWGKAWCDNLESYSDFENRLPRGRTYVRNGSVIDLQIERGKVKALVSGSEVYRVTIDITTVPAAKWERIKTDCARSVSSLIDLLQGRFDKGVMQRLTEHEGGLFPQPSEIEMKCSCPDWAVMCKHVAATLYGVGARLDVAPELLFTLRNVDHLELISQAMDSGNLDRNLKSQAGVALAGADLEEIFGIDLDDKEGAEAKSTFTAAGNSGIVPKGSARQARDNKKSSPSRAKAKKSFRKNNKKAKAVSEKSTGKKELAGRKK